MLECCCWRTGQGNGSAENQIVRLKRAPPRKFHSISLLHLNKLQYRSSWTSSKFNCNMFKLFNITPKQVRFGLVTPTATVQLVRIGEQSWWWRPLFWSQYMHYARLCAIEWMNSGWWQIELKYHISSNYCERQKPSNLLSWMGWCKKRDLFNRFSSCY